MFIPTWSTNKPAAWEFMKMCNSGMRLNRAAATAWVNATGQPARLSALNALVAVNDPRLEQALRATVRNADLESSVLLARTEKLLRERKVKL